MIFFPALHQEARAFKSAEVIAHRGTQSGRFHAANPQRMLVSRCLTTDLPYAPSLSRRGESLLILRLFVRQAGFATVHLSLSSWGWSTVDP